MLSGKWRLIPILTAMMIAIRTMIPTMMIPATLMMETGTANRARMASRMTALLMMKATIPARRSDVSGLSNVKILITLPYGKGCIGSEEFVPEDLGQEDIVGNVLMFEAVATDSAVVAAEVALVSRVVEGAEGGGNVLGELWGPVVVLTASGEGKLLRSRSRSRAWISFLGVAEDRGDVGLESWCREPDQVFELALEDESGIPKFFPRETERWR